MDIDPSDIIASLALVVSISAVFVTWRLSKRANVRQAVEVMTSLEVAQARDTVGRAAHYGAASAGIRADKLRAATFTLLWAMEEATMAARHASQFGLAHKDSPLLYRHLSRVLEDLCRALGDPKLNDVDFKPAAEYAAEGIDRLPRTGFEFVIERRGERRILVLRRMVDLDAPTSNRLRTAADQS